MVFSDAALTLHFSSLLVAAYLCPCSLVSVLVHWTVQSPNITFIDFMKSLIYCKICSCILPSICIVSANMVSSWEDQTLRKGQTFPFWQEEVLYINDKEFWRGDRILSPVPQQWIVLGCYSLCQAFAWWISCKASSCEPYTLQSSWSTLTFLSFDPQNCLVRNHSAFWMTFLRAIKVIWLAQAPIDTGGAEPRPWTWGCWCHSCLSLSLSRLSAELAFLSKGN